MAVAVTIALIVAFIAATIGYQQMLEKGLRARRFASTQSPEAIRSVFTAKVAGMGWHVVDDDDPMIAQSPLLAGRRQQIALWLTPTAQGHDVHVAPVRVWRKGLARMPYKAHTLRMRMNAFESGVRRLDGTLR